MIQNSYPVCLKIVEAIRIIKSEKLRLWIRFPYFRLLYNTYDCNTGDELDKNIESEIGRFGEINLKSYSILNKSELELAFKKNIIGDRHKLFFQLTPNLPDGEKINDGSYRNDESLIESKIESIAIYSNSIDPKYITSFPNVIAVSLPANKLNFLFNTFRPQIFDYSATL